MSAPERPYVGTPADGQAITLDDLAAFAAEAIGKGFPGSTPVHVTGSLAGFDLTNGPLAARVTVLPSEVWS